MMQASSSIRPWYAAERVTVPQGVIVPDLSVKRSLVLDAWSAKRNLQRSQAIQRERLQIQARAYEGAEVSRLTNDWWAPSTSADSELLTSLRVLRNRTRQLVRDNPYARHSVRLIVNNVIGAGTGLQAQVVNTRGKLQTSINDSIEDAWTEWTEAANCHTAGLLHFSQLERLLMAQLIVSGEAIVRIIRQPMGNSTIPLALEVIEADRLMDQWQTARAPNGNAIRMGVEVNDWGRPTAYWFLPRHPGDYQFTTFDPAKYLRVPAADIIHLYVIDRWPQTRGEPWFSAALRNIHDIHEFESSSLVKARAAANIVGFIKSPEAVGADATQAGRRILETEPGTWQTLLNGEDVAGFNAPAPSPELDPFLKHMVRKHAVAVGVSYEAASRDYIGATYSSMRVGMLDDRDGYRVHQAFFGVGLRMRVHREFTDACALVGRIKVGNDYFTNSRKYQAARFKFRGWSWIDPAKEVTAFRMAVRSGFMTQGDVISQTSPDKDVEDVMRERAEELEMAADMGLVFDTDPAQVNDKGQAQPTPVAPADEGVGGDAGAQGAAADGQSAGEGDAAGAGEDGEAGTDSDAADAQDN